VTDRKTRILELFAAILFAPLNVLFMGYHGLDEWWDKRADAKRPRRRDRRRGE